MVLDRDELAARFAVVLLANTPKGAAFSPDDAVECADALLSRLSAPSSPPCHGECDTPPPGRCSTGCAPDERPVSPPSCDAPESPATYVPTPAKSGAAAYVPQVGDVVKHVNESDATALTGQIRVVVSTNPLRWVYVEDGKACGSNEPRGWVDDVRFVRKATASELAAAGLPPAEATRSVGREGLMKAIHDAIDKWHGCSSDERDIDEVRADAAIAYFKNGGVA